MPIETLKELVHQYVETQVRDPSNLGRVGDDAKTWSEVKRYYEQLMFSTLVILFRTLSMLSLEECLGKRPCNKYLLAAACIAAASTCDNNTQAKPFFPKSITLAAFIAYVYHEHDEVVECHAWKASNSDQINQMFNSIIQAVDFNLEVVSPMSYLESALPS